MNRFDYSAQRYVAISLMFFLCLFALSPKSFSEESTDRSKVNEFAGMSDEYLQNQRDQMEEFIEQQNKVIADAQKNLESVDQRSRGLSVQDLEAQETAQKKIAEAQALIKDAKVGRQKAVDELNRRTDEKTAKEQAPEVTKEMAQRLETGIRPVVDLFPNDTGTSADKAVSSEKNDSATYEYKDENGKVLKTDKEIIADIKKTTDEEIKLLDDAKKIELSQRGNNNKSTLLDVEKKINDVNKEIEVATSSYENTKKEWDGLLNQMQETRKQAQLAKDASALPDIAGVVEDSDVEKFQKKLVEMQKKADLFNDKLTDDDKTLRYLEDRKKELSEAKAKLEAEKAELIRKGFVEDVLDAPKRSNTPPDKDIPMGLGGLWGSDARKQLAEVDGKIEGYHSDFSKEIPPEDAEDIVGSDKKADITNVYYGPSQIQKWEKDLKDWKDLQVNFTNSKEEHERMAEILNEASRHPSYGRDSIENILQHMINGEGWDTRTPEEIREEQALAAIEKEYAQKRKDLRSQAPKDGDPVALQLEENCLVAEENLKKKEESARLGGDPESFTYVLEDARKEMAAAQTALDGHKEKQAVLSKYEAQIRTKEEEIKSMETQVDMSSLPKGNEPPNDMKVYEAQMNVQIALAELKIMSLAMQKELLETGIKYAPAKDFSAEYELKTIEGQLAGAQKEPDRLRGEIQSMREWKNSLDIYYRNTAHEGDEKKAPEEQNVQAEDKNMEKLKLISQASTGAHTNEEKYTEGEFAGLVKSYAYAEKYPSGDIVAITRSNIEYEKDGEGKVVATAYQEVQKNSSGEEIRAVEEVNIAYDGGKEKDYQKIVTGKDPSSGDMTRTLTVVKDGKEEAKVATALDKDGNEIKVVGETKTQKEAAALEALHEINRASKHESPNSSSPASMKKVAEKKFKEGMEKLGQVIAKIDASAQESAARMEKIVEQGHAVQHMQQEGRADNRMGNRAGRETTPTGPDQESRR